MKVYMVYRQGVYMQGVVGIYSTLLKANDAIIKARGEEPDSYHSFDINIVELDKYVSLEGC